MSRECGAPCAGCSYLLLMGNIGLLFTVGDGAIVFFAAGILSDKPLIVQAIPRDLMVNMWHVPVEPRAPKLVIETADGCIPGTAAQSVAAFDE